MKTYAELNRENIELKNKLQIFEEIIEAEKENFKIIELRNKNASNILHKLNEDTPTGLLFEEIEHAIFTLKGITKEKEVE